MSLTAGRPSKKAKEELDLSDISDSQKKQFA